MTTANPEDTAVRPARPGGTVATGTVEDSVPARAPLGSGVIAGWRSVRAALDRPLTSYYLLLGASALLLTIGVIMVLSASSVRSYTSTGDSYAIVKRQLLWVAIGLPCAWVASRLPIRHIRRLAYPGFVFALVLLALVARFGVLINGNKNWLQVGPFTMQPAEVAKLAIVLWAANIYAHKERRLRELHHLLVPVVPGLFAVIGLVLVGRDLGTALVLAAILLGMLWVVGAPMRLFGLSISVLGVAALAMAATNAERLKRITHFTDPFKDYTDAGWQPAHGLYALSSGGWFGQGIGASTQKWGDLPEAHTDFIFAVLGEELGLVGTLLVVGLFFTIAYAAIRVALSTADPFVRYATFGIVVWILGQMMINVGMVLAVLPVIGIPLPIVSYGGSALLPSLVALGLLIGFARREPEAAAALAARRRNRSAGLSAGTSR
ncbi:putative lipid II flippase FtsW [Nocardioides hwasunensis]|uniref:Probable peptidoglycan glycosyltransferase FtsW n=1 Tax=Nocardioides hwasunensis TaxID=397258 RepID=A0ABR8MEG3_9ACTN|nr:putative lipid II flippase FtsW [Nocardioides hwasunensis]MBD3913461.1 putative lipid II flippase FtsW [Nocardioides hwasunensis]